MDRQREREAKESYSPHAKEGVAQCLSREVDSSQNCRSTQAERARKPQRRSRKGIAAGLQARGVWTPRGNVAWAPGRRCQLVRKDAGAPTRHFAASCGPLNG